MKEKKLNIAMTKDEFITFKNALNQGEEAVNECIEQYIISHKKQNLSKDDVLSLLLICAIPEESKELIQNILSIPHEGNILATVDKDGYNPISILFTLRHRPVIIGEYMVTDVMDMVENYLKERKNTIQKVDLQGDTFLSIRSSMWGLVDNMTVFDTVPYAIEHFLRYTYTPGSLDQFQSSFNDDFDINKYKTSDHNIFFQNWQPQCQESDLSSEKKRKLEHIGGIEKTKTTDTKKETTQHTSTNSSSQSTSSSSLVNDIGKESQTKVAKKSNDNSPENKQNTLYKEAEANSSSYITIDKNNFLELLQERKINQITFNLYSSKQDEISASKSEQEEANKAKEEIKQSTEDQVAKIHLLTNERYDLNYIDDSFLSNKYYFKGDIAFILRATLISPDSVIIEPSMELSGLLFLNFHQYMIAEDNIN